MVESLFHKMLCWLLLLCVGHCPVPSFDADWEDRGVPFDSVFDAHAWHPMLLGVAAPDDIDRGPFREKSDDGSTSSTSPYGAEFVVSTGAVALSQPVASCGCDVVSYHEALPSRLPAALWRVIYATLADRHRSLCSPGARAALICVMQI
ncbi:MAG: hypothetical protein HQ518_17250 [Rhodopirellula sp.]|nr:hypothetical protein [Rhodopirellula sp.]